MPDKVFIPYTIQWPLKPLQELATVPNAGTDEGCALVDHVVEVHETCITCALLKTALKNRFAVDVDR